MPTVKLDINTGIEYSPTDGIDSAVKLHNFTVGTDGSLYKLPMLKNLKNTEYQIWSGVDKEAILPGRLLDIKKFQTSAIGTVINPTEPPLTLSLQKTNMFRRFVYLSNFSYGVLNAKYDGSLVRNDEIEPNYQKQFGSFEYVVVDLLNTDLSFFDVSSLGSKILVDYNAQYDDDYKPYMRCVFPAQYHFPNSGTTYDLLIRPRNIIHCSMEYQAVSELGNPPPDIRPLSLEDRPNDKREQLDLARGCIFMGNRMFFYSAVDNAIYVSAKNKFRILMKNPDASTKPFKIVPSSEIQGITDFNGNIITFTPDGIERWLISQDEETIIQRDPTFHYDHRCRYNGSFVKANRDLYFYTDDVNVFRLNSDLSVDTVFNGDLPVYKPLQNYLSINDDLPMAYFKMLGSHFVSLGPWLYNIDSNTWSTYSYDGWKNPPYSSGGTTVIWENDTAKQVISTAYDDIVCTYSTLCVPATYNEMQQVSQETPSLTEDEYQWGEVAFFTTRMFQDESTFSLDGVEVYVRGGMLAEGSKMWLKILRGADDGDFDIDDESTYGVPAHYQPMKDSTLGENQKEHVGHFIWPRPNIKTDRFRLQFITKEKKGIVIQSVLANITTMSEAESFLVNKSKQKE